jgi:hypothetical protein
MAKVVPFTPVMTALFDVDAPDFAGRYAGSTFSGSPLRSGCIVRRNGSNGCSLYLPRISPFIELTLEATGFCLGVGDAPNRGASNGDTNGSVLKAPLEHE